MGLNFLAPMPVLALCEKGLIMDVFGEKPVIRKCHKFDCKQNTLALYFNNTLQFIDLKNLNVQKDAEVSDVSTLQLSNNGRNLAVMSHNGTLKVFRDCVEILNIDCVELFDISDAFCCFVTKDNAKIVSLETKSELLVLETPVKAVFAFNTLVFLVSDKKEDQRMLMFRNEKLTTLLALPNIYRAVLKGSIDESQFLFLIDTDYTKNSYYAESSLFLVSWIGVEQSFDKDSTDPTVPSIIDGTAVPAILSYKNMTKIHSVGFLKDSFYVCFGDQPASMYQFKQNGTVLRRHNNTVRNTIVFNSKETRVINAGLGNLPGNINVFCGKENTCSFEILGASIVSWLNNDTHFMVAITNYFKSQNKIVIFDYYGRPLEEMECRSLVDARVYGDKSAEVDVEAPEILEKPATVSTYVPPHLQNKGAIPTIPIKTPRAKRERKPKARSQTTIEMELNECLALRDKLRNGEELSLDDENKIFRIKELEEELKLLSNNKS